MLLQHWSLGLGFIQALGGTLTEWRYTDKIAEKQL